MGQIKIMDSGEMSPESALVGVENALAGSIAGYGGWGVQQIRDANGKLIEVYVFFDDKVPQNERAAALDRINSNHGVASVKPAAGRTMLITFDTSSSLEYPMIGVSSIAGSVTVSPTKFASAPNAAALLAPVSSGSAVHSNLRTAAGWVVGAYQPLTRSVFRAKVCLDGFGTDANVSAQARLQILAGYVVRPGSASQVIMDYLWNPTGGGIANTGVPYGTGILAGNTAGLEIPFDSNFHEIEFTMLSPTTATWRVDSTTRTFQIPATSSGVLAAPNVYDFSLSSWNIDASKTAYVDDIFIDYEVVPSA